MSAIFRRELSEYFNSMLGYAYLGAFVFLSGLLFVSNNIIPLDSGFNNTLSDCVYVFMMTAPLLTMRLVSEEKRTKRDQLLLTTSLSLRSIIVGKYLAAYVVYLVGLALTLIFPIILIIFGNPPIAMIINGYFGLMLVGAAIAGVGMLISTLTENQISAALGTYGLLLLFLTMDMLIPLTDSSILVTILEWFSLFKRFEVFHYGSLSLSAIVYYIVFAVSCLYLSTKALERRRLKST